MSQRSTHLLQSDMDQVPGITFQMLVRTSRLFVQHVSCRVNQQSAIKQRTPIPTNWKVPADREIAGLSERARYVWKQTARTWVLQSTSLIVRDSPRFGVLLPPRFRKCRSESAINSPASSTHADQPWNLIDSLRVQTSLGSSINVTQNTSEPRYRKKQTRACGQRRCIGTEY